MTGARNCSDRVVVNLGMWRPRPPRRSPSSLLNESRCAANLMENSDESVQRLADPVVEFVPGDRMSPRYPGTSAVSVIARST